jgi:acyl-coenzyme A thioesterase PaaI-like protein
VVTLEPLYDDDVQAVINLLYLSLHYFTISPNFNNPLGMATKSLQDKYAPHNACFGCGPSNEKGLQIKSHVGNDGTIMATWQPEEHHQAFPGVLCGGIIGTLMDCHSNWSAAYFLMTDQGLKTPPCTVTADYAVKLKKPTPLDQKVFLKARLIKIDGDKAKVSTELLCQGEVCATCEGTFVAVKEGHPAYHRW